LKGSEVATPDYLQQAIIAGSRYDLHGKRQTMAQSGFRRPSASTAIWAGLDIITVILAAMIAVRVRVETPSVVTPLGVLPHLVQSSPNLLFFYVVWFGVCLVFFSRSYGLYRTVQHYSGLHEQRMTVQATLTSGLLLCGTLYMSNGEEVSRIVVGLMVLFTSVLLCLRRGLWRRMMYRKFRAGVETRNVLIVGTGRVGHALRNHIDSLQHLGFRFKGFVALSQRESEAGDSDVIGDVRNCLTLARSLFVDEIFFSVPAEQQMVIGMVEEARVAGIDVRVVPEMYEGLAWNARVEYVGQFPTIPLHRRSFPVGGFLVKRTLDITLSALALLVLAPVMLGIAISILLDSKGSIFYKAQRIGRKGRTFACYKFRTMVPDAERRKAALEHMNERRGILFKIAKDPRITSVGSILRKYSLDELPQFYNVLKGDMSLVGPRPPMAAEVKQYDLAHLRRLDVLPGITGLWQVEARQDPSFDSYISLDTAYVENWNLMMDLRILARTVGVVLSGTGS
jgi:exopolysaccharide biosynthesis polyprenyl glycosylphosphotransferase